jgi:hypothetical protein
MKEADPSRTNRQRGEPELDDICRRCGAPDQFYCCCLTTPPPLGKYPYKIAISRDELALALRHRARTGEPIQRFVRRLIWEAARLEMLDDPIQSDNTPSDLSTCRVPIRRAYRSVKRAASTAPSNLEGHGVD